MRIGEILKTEAVALRIVPFSNTSHMVTWLTGNGRLVTTAVKGARRNKSSFLGQYDFLYKCELLYYAKESRNGIHTAKEISPVAIRNNLRNNWRAEQCASWFASLALHATRCADDCPAVFRLLDETLDLLDSPSAPDLEVFLRYELKFLDILGAAPNMSSPPCGCPTENGFRFSIPEGRIVCRKHDDPKYQSPGIRLPEKAVYICRQTLAGESVSGISAADDAATRLLRCIGLFIRYHLDDMPMAGRYTAVSAITVPRAYLPQ